MNACSVLANFFRVRLPEKLAAVQSIELEQPIRLPPTLDAHELPPEFEEVLEVQVLGYRERMAQLHGQRLRVLDPVWTLVPKHR